MRWTGDHGALNPNESLPASLIVAATSSGAGSTPTRWNSITEQYRGIATFSAGAVTVTRGVWLVGTGVNWTGTAQP
jgi:hypothetical protein